MGRYLKLYLTYTRCSIASRLEYKKDTFIAIFGFLIQNIASLAGIYFVVRAIPSLDGWSIYQIGFLYGFAMIPKGIDHLFTDGFWLVAYRRVKSGDLDGNFLRPVPVIFQIIAERFQPDAFGELIVGVAMLVSCGIAASVPLSFSSVLLLIVASIFGAMLITGVKILLSSLAFVFKTTGPLLQVIYNFLDYVKYPISIFPGFIQSILIFMVPFGLCISLPVQAVFFGGYQPYLLMLFIALGSTAFLALSILVWSLLEKRYQSTGN